MRQEGGGGGGGRGARVETVVVFMPDVWTCMPTALEWEQTRGLYRQLAAGSETTDGATDELQALHHCVTICVLCPSCVNYLPCHNRCLSHTCLQHCLFLVAIAIVQLSEFKAHK